MMSVRSQRPIAAWPAPLVAFFLVFIFAGSSVSHPLGNFSINHYTRIKLKPAQAELVYLLDMAEIPSYSEFLEIDTDEDGNVTAGEQEAYLAKKVPELLRGIEVRIAGVPVEVTPSQSLMKFPMGEGGQTLVNVLIRSRVEFPVPTGGAIAFAFEDRTCAGQLGQAAIQIEPGEDIRIELDTSEYGEKDEELVRRVGNWILVQDSRVSLTATLLAGEAEARPTEESPVSPSPTPLLEVADVSIRWATAIPPVSTPRMDPLDYARDVFSATLAEFSGRSPRHEGEEVERDFVDRIGGWLRQKEWSTRMLVVAFLIAFVAGMFHALKPGHGKAIAAAYLVGSRGTPVHALILGGIVTVTHTGSILILGTILLLALKSVHQAKVQMMIEVASGVIIVFLGVLLFYRRLSALVRSRRTSTNAHQHDHPHNHDSHDDHDRRHSHEIPDKVTWGSLLALGFSGGIVPCPGALLLLTAAMAARRLALGLTLILVYSLGLGVALITIGMLTVMSKSFLEKRFDFRAGRIHWLPVLSPIAITFFGLVIIVRALVSAGIVDIGI